jgi:hypothetical protein
MAFYMFEASDNPRERAGQFGSVPLMELTAPENVSIPDEGGVPISVCVESAAVIGISDKITDTFVEWRLVRTRASQSDYNFTKYTVTTPFKRTAMEWQANCTLSNNATGRLLQANLSVPEDKTGLLEYRATLTTVAGTEYVLPEHLSTYTVGVPWRAAFGNWVGALFMFIVITTAVWGGLGLTLRAIFASGDEEELEGLHSATGDPESPVLEREDDS